MQLFLFLAIQHTLKIFFLRVTQVSFFLSQISVSVIVLLVIQQVPFFFFYYLHFTPITRIYPSIYLSIHPSIHPPIHLSVIYFQRDMKYHRDSKSQSYIRRHTQRSVVPSYDPVPISPLFPLHSYPHPPIVNNFISF